MRKRLLSLFDADPVAEGSRRNGAAYPAPASAGLGEFAQVDSGLPLGTHWRGQVENPTEPSSAGIRAWWARRGPAVLRLAVATMAIAAAAWLGYEFFRLLAQPAQLGGRWILIGAIDLGQRHVEVHRWFAGQPIYFHGSIASYPPATYLMLWPFLGWLDVHAAAWLWALSSVAALLWLCRIVVRASGADTRIERTFVALVPLSMYATGACIGNGQLTVHVMPILLAAVLALRGEQVSWRRDLAASALMVLALSKPSLTVGFVWIALFVPRRSRPFLLVVAGYLALTLLATSFQAAGTVSLLGAWVERGTAIASGAAVTYSHGNLHSWLAALGLERWNSIASLLALVLLGGWVRRHRDADLWLLMGVTGIFTRLWTYHGWYDDLVILPALIALHRMARQGKGSVLAAVLLAASLGVMIAPGGQYLLPRPWNSLYMAGQLVVWLLVLGYLIALAARPIERSPDAQCTFTTAR